MAMLMMAPTGSDDDDGDLSDEGCHDGGDGDTDDADGHDDAQSFGGDGGAEEDENRDDEEDDDTWTR